MNVLSEYCRYISEEKGICNYIRHCACSLRFMFNFLRVVIWDGYYEICFFIHRNYNYLATVNMFYVSGNF